MIIENSYDVSVNTMGDPSMYSRYCLMRFLNYFRQTKSDAMEGKVLFMGA